MSVLGRLRNAVNYEARPPRCSNCVHLRTATEQTSIYTEQGDGKWPRKECGKFLFRVQQCGICDYWTDRKTGETLQDAPENDERVEALLEKINRNGA